MTSHCCRSGCHRRWILQIYHQDYITMSATSISSTHPNNIHLNPHPASTATNQNNGNMPTTLELSAVYHANKQPKLCSNIGVQRTDSCAGATSEESTLQHRWTQTSIVMLTTYYQNTWTNFTIIIIEVVAQARPKQHTLSSVCYTFSPTYRHHHYASPKEYWTAGAAWNHPSRTLPWIIQSL